MTIHRSFIKRPTIKRNLLALAAPIALLGMAGCATDFHANVARFQRLPAPQGQTYVIQAMNPANRGGLEFATYANDVSAHLAQLGYRPVAPGTPADMIVQLGYGVDHGQQKVTTYPGFAGYGPGWGRPGWGGFGGWGGRGWAFGGWGAGWGGWDGFGGPDVESYTVYTSMLNLTITGAGGARLFEGRARAHSTTADLTRLVPNLIDAMFTGFPGNSGQEIQITVQPPKRG